MRRNTKAPRPADCLGYHYANGTTNNQLFSNCPTQLQRKCRTGIFLPPLNRLLARTFGLGAASIAQVDVLWPGGVRNRLYHARAGTHLLPEIPCSYDTTDSLSTYGRCVRRALRQYRRAGVINFFEQGRLSLSAIVAYLEHHFG